MGDFNKNGRDDLVSCWPGAMWIRYDNGSWYQAYGIAPYRVTTGDVIPDLSGTWLLTNYLGNTFTAIMEKRGTNRYYLYSPSGGVVVAGLYEIQRNYLVMVEPDNPNYSGFIWEVININYLYLANTGYRGSTLTR